jgi:hypothetical protein
MALQEAAQAQAQAPVVLQEVSQVRAAVHQQTRVIAQEKVDSDYIGWQLVFSEVCLGWLFNIHTTAPSNKDFSRMYLAYLCACKGSRHCCTYTITLDYMPGTRQVLFIYP